MGANGSADLAQCAAVVVELCVGHILVVPSTLFLSFQNIRFS